MKPTPASDHATEAAAITPSWLTAVLGRAGVSPNVKVRRLHLLSRQRTAGGSLAHFDVDYTGASPHDLPSRIVVKLPRPDRPVDLMDSVGQKEVTFYREIAPSLSGVSIPRCLAAATGGPGHWYVILEDLSDTHSQTQWPIPPSKAGCAAAIDALAGLHASLWGSPQFEAVAGGPPGARQIVDDTRRAADLAQRFVTFLDDRLSPTRRHSFDQTVAGLPRIWQWWCDPSSRILVHGDAHAWNMLFPLPTAGGSPSESVSLIDWQNWQVAPPAFDLATFMALDWYPARRARMELPLLQRYHRRLCALGVHDYPWEACHREYRLATANTLFTCAWRWSNGTEALYWWPHLECALSAFEDLDCASLLAP